MLYSTFALTAITLCHVSPNPMAVPKLFLQDLKKRTKTTFRKNLRKIKIFVFCDSKGQSAVMMTFDLNSMGYTI